MAAAGRDTSTFKIIASPARPETLDTLREIGVDGAIFGLPSKGRDDVMSRLDHLTEALDLA